MSPIKFFSLRPAGGWGSVEKTTRRKGETRRLACSVGFMSFGGPQVHALTGYQPAGEMRAARIDGKCTIKVNVDGSAEVEVQGDTGRIRNLSGQRAVWRRFVCNGRMPASPGDFRFRGIDGRGDVQLPQDPRQAGGWLVFRIDDPQGGREGYTVDFEWRGSRGGQWGNQDTRGWCGPGVTPAIGGGVMNRDPRYYNQQGLWNREGAARAIRVCQTAAAERIQQDGFRNVAFRNVVPDNNPGRNDWVSGSVTAPQGPRNARFQFSCSVDLSGGPVRWVNVDRR